MHVLPPPLDLSLAGFQTDDIFKRVRLADGLTNLLSISEDPLVIALDGQWGAGKTTFLSMWSDKLAHAGFPVIRFDAFEHDYVEDPFLALAGEIIALAEHLAPQDKKKREEFVAKTKAAGKVIIRHGAGAAVKILTLGALDAVKATDEISGAVADALKDASDSYLDEVLTTQNAQRQSLDRFREALTELPARLKPPATGEIQKPLIFIIDELDRCRPIFALQVLERIKHFFAVQNVHFVLGANLSQLRTSVSAAYGEGVNSVLYLQKFIHLTFQLTTGDGKYSKENLGKFIDYLIERLNFQTGRLEAVRRASTVILNYAVKHDLNLRGIERVMMTLALGMGFLRSEDRNGPPYILGGLCILKIQHPELFAMAKRGTLQFPEIQTIFELSGMARWSDTRTDSDEIAWWWTICTGGGYDGAVRSFIEDRLEGRSPENVVAWIANDVVDRLQAT